MLKKAAALLLALLLALPCAALADSIDLDGMSSEELYTLYGRVLERLMALGAERPAPVPTVETKIQFRGMDIGAACSVFTETLAAEGIKGAFREGDVASWEAFYKSGDLVSEKTLDTGGFTFTSKSLANNFTVAGLSVDKITAWFMLSYDDAAINYAREDAVLYKAMYNFSAMDANAAYALLSQKLSALYGKGLSYTETRHGTFGGDEYTAVTDWTCWYGADNTAVRLQKTVETFDVGSRAKSQSLTLTYGLSNSGALITGLQAAIAREELQQAMDMNDTDGL